MSKGDSPCGLFIIGIVLFLGGLAKIYATTQKYLLAQKIKNTPTSKVESAAVGLVELFGKAECPETIPAPISRVDCSYWKIHADYYKSGKHGGWRTIYDKISTNRFYLADDSGKMLIDPKDAQVDVKQDALYQGYISGKGVFGVSHTQFPQSVLSFIDTLPANEKSSFTNHSNVEVRIYEYYIADGDPLYVLGSAEPLEGASSSLGYENLIVKKGKYDQTMYITDSEEKKVLQKMSGGSIIWGIALGLGMSIFGLGLCILLVLSTFKWI